MPYLLVSICTIAGYTLLRWYLDIELGIIHVKEDILNFWVPMILPWIGILIFLRKPLRMLSIKGKRDNGHFIYQAFIWGFTLAPTIVAQEYLTQACYDLNKVVSAEEIHQLPNEKFFAIDSIKVDKALLIPYYRSNVSGRRSSNLNFHVYYACPVQDRTYTTWVGYHASMQVKNSLSDTEKEEAFEEFAEETWVEFQTYDYDRTIYFSRVPHSDDLDGYWESIVLSGMREGRSDEVVVITDHREPFEARLGDKFEWIFIWIGAGALIFLIMVAVPKIDQAEIRESSNKKQNTDDDLNEALAFLNPLGQHKVGALLIWLNIIAFVGMLYNGVSFIHPTASDLLELGGNRRTEVLDGEYWRLITSVFMHGGIIHLVLNIVGLCIGVVLIDKKLHPLVLIVAYLITGVLASVASILWNDNIVSVGASGAIFGLFGIIAAFNLFKVYGKEGSAAVWILLAIYGGVSLVMGFFGNADNAAHVGGLIAGFVVGMALIPIAKKGGDIF